MTSIIVFIPDELYKQKPCYMFGKTVFDENRQVKKFYIIDVDSMNFTQNDESIIHPIGQYLYGKKQNPYGERKSSNWINLNCIDGPKCDYFIDGIIINDKEIALASHQLVLIVYDKIALQSSELFHNKTTSGNDFYELVNILKKETTIEKNKNQYFKRLKKVWISLMFSIFYLIGFLSFITNKLLPILKYSSLLLHLHEWMKNIQWLITAVRESKKISLKTGNYIVACIVDIILGSLMLELIFYFIDNDTPSTILITNAEKVMGSLINLINWLMGVPVGLKLNYAFNKTLGKFFLYNIHLWWTFLTSMRPIMDLGFDILMLLGRLGITFQLSIAIDILMLVSLHINCIYIYAARLFNIQLQGITALSRLFVGKKKNPLRQRIDSCEYQPDQLFIGTLLFTILLFLMPTTLVYYTVFVMLRLVLIGVNNFLCYLKFNLQVLPVYTFVNWILRSYCTCGNIDINVHKFHTNGQTTLKMTLDVSGWAETREKSVPDVAIVGSFIDWQNIVTRLIWGKLLRYG